MLTNRRDRKGSPLGCGAKRTFHLQFFAISFADEMDHFLTVNMHAMFSLTDILAFHTVDAFFHVLAAKMTTNTH